MLLDSGGLQERVARVESLLAEIEALEDARAKSMAAEIVGVLLELYGEGLARMMERVADGPDRERAFEAFASDELVSHLLLLHGLHPQGVETRVLQALEEVRPYLNSHGGDVELLGIEGGVARVRLQGSCDGCPSSAVTLKLAIEEAIEKAAPDLAGVEAEGVAAPPVGPTLVAGPRLPRKKPRQENAGEPHKTGAAWTVVGGLPQLSKGGKLVKEISGETVLFARVGDDLYSYRHSCPGCGESLESGVLEGAELRCVGCGRRYDVRRAGRSLDDSQLHLEPIPLLVSEEPVEDHGAPGRRSVVRISLPTSAVG